MRNGVRGRGEESCRAIPQAFLEELILSELTDHVLQIDRLAHIQTLARGSESDRLKSLRDERTGHQHALVATRQRIAKLVDTIADSGHSPAILQRLSDLEHEERDLVARVDEVDEAIQNVGYNLSQTQLAAVANQIIAALRSPHLSERRTALRALVSSIVVERTEENKIAGEIRFYVPSGDFMATGQCPQGVFTHSHKFSAVFRPHDRSA